MPRSSKYPNFHGVSQTYSPYSPMPNMKQNTSKFAVQEQERLYGLPVDSTKKAGVRRLNRFGVDIPQFDDEDAQCAARFPQFSDYSKEDILDMAEMLGVNTAGMAKIDGCHALHQLGVQTEDHIVEVLNAVNYSPVATGAYAQSQAREDMINANNPTMVDMPKTPGEFGKKSRRHKKVKCMKSKVKGRDGKMKMLMRKANGRFCKKH